MLAPPTRAFSARQASWLLVRAAEDLTQEEKETLERLLRHCADAATAYPLAQAFTEMVRRRIPEAYDGCRTIRDKLAERLRG